MKKTCFPRKLWAAVERAKIGALPQEACVRHAASDEPAKFRFGLFEVDCVEGRLYKRGNPQRIENHALLVLVALLERPDEVVTREELQQRIWRDGTNVDFENGLNTAVRKLRLALGDSADSPLFIETVPTRGYRFVAPLIDGNSDGAIGKGDSVQTANDQEIHLVEDTSEGLSQAHPANSPRVARQNRPRMVAAVIVLVVASATVGLLFWQRARSRWASSLPVIPARKVEGVHTRQAVSLSPDGRYVAYARSDGHMSSVHLHQVANAGEVEILPPRKTFYVGLAFSPDGNELYYVRADESNPIYRSLYRMPVLGGPTQKLIENMDSPISFSPDGRRFVFARFRAATSTLEVRTANADGSGEELLTQFTGYAWGCLWPYVTWSPDGRTIAIPFRGRLTPDRSSLYVIDVTTRRAEEVYSGNQCIGRPVWTRDKALIFPREGELLMVRDRIGGVRRLQGYDGLLGGALDLSRDGKTAVTIGYQSRFGLWVVPVKPASPPKQLMSGDASLTYVDELIDGRILVTKVDGSVWTTKADGSDWQRLANIRGVAIACGQFVVVWTTDGRSLVRFSADGTVKNALVRGPTMMPTCSLKGDAVVYVASAEPRQVMRVPIDGGEPVIVAKIQEGVLESLRISPDGDFLAYTFYDRRSKPETGFAVLRASDGSLVKVIGGVKSGAYNFHWAPDGQSLDYASVEDEWADVWEQPLAGNAPRPITRFGSGVVSEFHWSRDGKRLLVVSGPVIDDVVLLSLQ